MTQHLCLCPLCGEGPVHESTFAEPYEYKGQTVQISLHCKQCDMCGSEFSDSSVSKKNQRVINAAKKRIDHLLESNTIAKFRRRWNITQAQAGKIFGGGPVAFSKYESDDVVQSEAMDKLIRVADAVPEARDWLFDQAGVDKKAHLSSLSPGVMALTAGIASRPRLVSSFSGVQGYMTLAQEYQMVIPIEGPLVPRSELNLHKVTVGSIGRIEPTVRLYGEEENQTYSHRPTYSEQDYELHSV